MKKTCALLIAAVCLTFTGCSNSFAREEYYSAEKITENDRYAENSVNVRVLSYDQYHIQAKRFDGRSTFLTYTSVGDMEITAIVPMSLSKGQVKIVLVDSNGKVSTVAELSAENSAQLLETRITVTKGDNKFKLVGYGCRNVDILMTLDNDSAVML